jgi:hypothetical protein
VAILHTFKERLNSVIKAFRQSEQEIYYLSTNAYFFFIFPVKSYDIEVSLSLFLIYLTSLCFLFWSRSTLIKIKLTKRNSLTSFLFSSRYGSANSMAVLMRCVILNIITVISCKDLTQLYSFILNFIFFTSQITDPILALCKPRNALP